MKVIRNKILPFGKRFLAINICGVLFAKGPCTSLTINHEEIHSAQIKELAYLFFYMWYGIEWVIRFMQYGNAYSAYKNISFEREAYACETDFRYLSRRSTYAFFKYLNLS